MTDLQGTPLRDDQSAAAILEREALRLFRRYQVEIVEAFNLCPWAEKARRDATIAERVFLQSQATPEPALHAIRELQDRQDIELCIFIFPCLSLSKTEFERFVSNLVQQDADYHGPGKIPFAMAAFHPNVTPDLATPDRLIPFLRRTPDPTIQLVRSSVLERVKSGKGDGTRFVDFADLDLSNPPAFSSTKSVRQRISEANYETVENLGVEHLNTIMKDIIQDRGRTYPPLIARL